MSFGWKVLLPLATVNLLADGGGGALLWPLTPALLRVRRRDRDRRAAGGRRSATRSTACCRWSVPFFGLSGLYVLLEAPFVAVVQIIIYAGAIMVLFLFVVMLLNVPREDAAEWDRIASVVPAVAVRIGAVLAVLMALELGWALSRTSGTHGRRRRRAARRIVGRRTGPRRSSPTTCSRSK